MAASSSKSMAATITAVIGGAVVLGMMGTALYRAEKKKEDAAAVERKTEAKAAAAPAPAAGASSSTAVVSRPPMPRSLSKEQPIRRQSALVVVDPVSTGANVCDEIMKRKIPCIRVFSSFVPESLATMVAPGLLHEFAATVYDDDADFQKTLTTLAELPYTIHAVIAGSELAIELADKLSFALGVRTNGNETSFLRRDKFQMGEAVRRSRVRAVKQARVQNWLHIENFLKAHDPKPFKVVIKPIRSAGSDGVSLCKDRDSLRKCLDSIVGKVNKMGMSNYAAVVQEYLEGDEYVVDTVSRDGVHKLAALWVYDKKAANQAAFVYFGMRTVDPRTELGERLFNYQKGVLDALGIVHGPGHGEVIDTKTGPCLVECGARPHGAEGTFMPLAQASFARDQVTMTVDCYSDSARFDAYETMPTLLQHSLKIDLVSSVTGTLDFLDHTAEIQRLSSFVRFDMLPKHGDHIPITVDCFTAVGSVSLTNKNMDQLRADEAKIRELEQTMFVLIGSAASVARASAGAAAAAPAGAEREEKASGAAAAAPAKRE